ncbi:MAG: hypothetical protein HDR75_03760 [Bacteroides sp.]|nr:hypothetical protein [Bacteroides sp.]
MGGNGARAAYMAGLLNEYSGPRFDECGRIGDSKVIKIWTQNNTKVPVESFNSDMYYVANPKTGTIEHIAFYDKDGNIKHSIDLDFNKDGSSKPYREYYRKGKLRSEGSHFHREWPIDENGDKGRVSHNKMNCEPINRYYMRFVKKAIEYNSKIQNKK